MEIAKIVIQAVMDAAMIVIMVLAALEDAKTGIVHPRYQIMIFALAVLHLPYAFIFEGWVSGVMHIAAGILLWGVQLLIFAIFKSGVGGADFKVSGSLALYLSLIPGLVMVLSHGLAAIGYALYMRFIKHKHKESVRLMPFLLIGFVIARIVGWIMMFV